MYLSLPMPADELTLISASLSTKIRQFIKAARSPSKINTMFMEETIEIIFVKSVASMAADSSE